MPEKLSRRHRKYFWKMIAYHLQTWRLLPIITKTCWGAPVTSSLQLFVFLSRQREKISTLSTMFALTSFPVSFTSVMEVPWNTSATLMQQHQHFTTVVGPDAWAAFRVKIWSLVYTLAISLSLNQVGWVLEMWLLLYIYICLKSSCTLMLIALCALMW